MPSPLTESGLSHRQCSSEGIRWSDGHSNPSGLSSAQAAKPLTFERVSSIRTTTGTRGTRSVKCLFQCFINVTETPGYLLLILKSSISSSQTMHADARCPKTPLMPIYCASLSSCSKNAIFEELKWPPGAGAARTGNAPKTI